MSNCKLRSRAFSLLELIITLAILSTSIVIILQAFSYSARMTGLSCDIINAALLTEDTLQELEYKEKKRLINTEPTHVYVPGVQKSKFDLEYTLNKNDELNLYKLDFNLTWQRANRKEDLKLNTYLR